VSSELQLATDLPASIPEVTAVGGTEFNEGNGVYWNSSNDSKTKASARSYIPETSWNDSTKDNATASGGGASQLFPKPSWQTGNGVPSDSSRDVPDLAFPGSADHDGYIVYTSGGLNAGWYAFGGTSAGAPSFSAVLALLNQYLIANGYQSRSGLGNVNPNLYQFAISFPSAFHDISNGDNIVTASVCTDFLCGSTKTESVGYNAGAGYDQVTGLGSIDVYNFVTGWQNATVSAAHSGVTADASITQSGTRR
jgi:subtilase family serine protease